MKHQFKLISSRELNGLQAGLQEFESVLTYPLDGQRSFRISHGKQYSAFFDRMGSSRFMVAMDRRKTIGILSIVFKQISIDRKIINSVYISDLKVDQAYRGGGVSTQMYLWSLLHGSRLRRFWSSSFFYFITMVGENGDVYRSTKKFSPMKLFQPMAEFAIYFSDPKKVVDMPCESAGINEGLHLPMLQLTPTDINESSDLISVMGEKDIILDNERLPMKLAHMKSIDSSGNEFVKRLNKVGSTASGVYDSLCFAVDKRRQQLIGYLDSFGIRPTGSARLYGFSWKKMNTFGACCVGTHQI